jgi:Na+-transporting NADH:ubiquinone oxidoreductase subunit NqrB
MSLSKFWTTRNLYYNCKWSRPCHVAIWHSNLPTKFSAKIMHRIKFYQEAYLCQCFSSNHLHTSRYTASASAVPVVMRFIRTNQKQMDIFHLKLFIIYVQNKIPSWLQMWNLKATENTVFIVIVIWLCLIWITCIVHMSAAKSIEMPVIASSSILGVS